MYILMLLSSLTTLTFFPQKYCFLPRNWAGSQKKKKKKSLPPQLLLIYFFNHQICGKISCVNKFKISWGDAIKSLQYNFSHNLFSVSLCPY